MTKINKLGKSTFVIAILSFLLVAVLAFGGTYAYFSAQSSQYSGNIVTGHLRINAAGEGNATIAAEATIGQPNQTVFDSDVSVTVNSNIAYYTRVVFTVDVSKKGAEQTITHAKADCGDGVDNALEILDINIENVVGNESTAAVTWLTEAQDTATERIYYKKEVTKPTLTNGTNAVDTTETFSFTIKINEWVGTNAAKDAAGCDFWMDRTITVTARVEVLQADYLGADAAEGVTDFADIGAAKTAWANLGASK